MSPRSMLARLIAPLAFLASVASLSTTAQAAPYTPLCAGAYCFNKDTQRYVNNRTYFYLTFKGSAVSHYNLRYREAGGREVQIEIGARPGSNGSYLSSLPGVPGKAYQVSVQARARVKIFVGPIVVSTRSGCTIWYRTTYKAV
jgi:hypothetical protein